MSENTLNTQIDGTTIQASHVNQFKTALVEDVLPRNLSGQNEDEAGSLGSDIYRWLKGIISTVFTNKISLGSAESEATNPSIVNNANNAYHNVAASKSHRFYVNGVLASIIRNTGFDGSYIETSTTPVNKLIRARARDTAAGGNRTTNGALTGLSANITASGLTPVMVKVQATGNTYLFPRQVSGSANISLRKNSVDVFFVSEVNTDIPIQSIFFLDWLPSGSCTYEVFIGSISGTVGWYDCEIIVMEL